MFNLRQLRFRRAHRNRAFLAERIDEAHHGLYVFGRKIILSSYSGVLSTARLPHLSTFSKAIAIKNHK